MEQVKKLKGEIKRLRQDLILKGSSGKRGNSGVRGGEDDNQSDDSDLGEVEEQALRMMQPDARKYFMELEQAGCKKSYIKKKIRQFVRENKNLIGMFPDELEVKGFKANYEISYNDLIFDRKISEGGYGIVYRGRWKYTTVAIKEIKREIIE